MAGRGKDFHTELTADVMIHGNCNYYGPARTSMKQDSFVQVHGCLNWRISPATFFGLGLLHETAGSTEVSAVTQNGPKWTAMFRLAATTFIDQRNQLMYSTGTDRSVRNGSKTVGRAVEAQFQRDEVSIRREESCRT